MSHPLDFETIQSDLHALRAETMRIHAERERQRGEARWGTFIAAVAFLVITAITRCLSG
jgi:hypothetical protein